MDWVGVDVGGTFTDAVAYDNDTGSLRWSKAPSTPAAPADGVRDALDRLGIQPKDMERIVHGVTIGTNAILERKGADVWFLTTKGFRDTLEIARTERRTLYDIKHLKPKSLIPRLRVLEIDERLNADGSVLRTLDEESLANAVRTLQDEKVEAVAVGFLHSYINTAHEDRAVAAIGAALPDAFVSSSSDVLPEFREYERFTTTVLNAYIGPLMQRYLDALSTALREAGYDRGVFLMTSSGGLARAERAARYPVHTVLSGPAGGVAASLDLGARLGIDNLITYDMGGTSTDVCLIEALTAPITGEQFIAEYPNRTPQIEINTVGAGGGSIAWVDSGDILKVGPRSAGAEPGPACYGRGGEEPTVTDANLMLRRLSPHSKLAGDMGLDEAPARDAMARLAERVDGLDMHQLADGIVRIAVARMVSAIREISVSRGYDPRDFALLAYGGAGPMHAAFVAEELEISRVVVPPSPGNFSAFGCLISDLRHDLVKTRMMETRNTPWAELEAEFQALEAEGRESLAGDGMSEGNMAFRRALGMRYIGQSWELTVDIGPEIGSADALEAVFRDAHERRYGHAGDGPTEIVSIRLGAIGAMSKPVFPDAALGVDIEDALLERRDVYFDGEFQGAPVYDRDRLPGAVTIPGPLLVEEMGALTVVPPGWTAAVGALGELSLTRTKP